MEKLKPELGESASHVLDNLAETMAVADELMLKDPKIQEIIRHIEVMTPEEKKTLSATNLVETSIGKDYISAYCALRGGALLGLLVNSSRLNEKQLDAVLSELLKKVYPAQDPGKFEANASVVEKATKLKGALDDEDNHEALKVCNRPGSALEFQSLDNCSNLLEQIISAYAKGIAEAESKKLKNLLSRKISTRATAATKSFTTWASKFGLFIKVVPALSAI